ncbi:hypothetical protein [Streptomyces sp. IB2014 016-6]|uniref:hypothetical protein n=1 Tax=Streptomyces sp. IB2014 016-6 TaxID=2517818 RepID=UPI0011C9BA0D|nr:hypothetical protein [Streptomyces sp. IB2014 016-6]TXL91607.1 hypothetical protein EW053_04580 [Streptomyces sp. IB2014 016-6]
MADLTDATGIDTLLRRILTEPSWPARLLCAIAQHLENDLPFVVLDVLALATAETAAEERILAALPDIVALEARDLTAAAMPMPRAQETGGEYALRLRAIARTV